MPTTDTTVPYEILIRYDEAGALQGAHYQTRRIMTVDGMRVMDQPGPAIPLALAASPDGPSLPTLQAVLDEALTTALAQVDTLTTALAAADARAEAAETRAAAAEARAAAAEAALEAAGS